MTEHFNHHVGVVEKVLQRSGKGHNGTFEALNEQDLHNLLQTASDGVNRQVAFLV